jgi:hypothetical protein
MLSRGQLFQVVSCTFGLTENVNEKFNNGTEVPKKSKPELITQLQHSQCGTAEPAGS